MDILTEVVTKYWVLGVSIVTLVGIYKFALVASQKGLLGALGQILAFGAVVAVLVLLAGPFLNWTFVTIVSHVGTNVAVNSALALTTQTIDLVKNAEVSSEPVLALDVTQEQVNAAVAEVKEKVSGVTHSSSNAANNAAPLVAKPSTPLVLQSAADPIPTSATPLIFKSAQDLPVPFIKPTQAPLVLESAADGGGPNRTYTVKRGDYLTKIAKTLGIDAKQLCAINSIRNCSVIHVNQVLVLP